MDGWVTIGTKIDSKQLEKDLKDAERRLQQFEKEAERLTKQEAKAKIDLEDYYKQKELIEQSTNKMLEHAQTEEHVNSVLELEKNNLQQLNEAYAKQLTNAQEINKKIQENAHNQGLVRNEIQQLNVELQKSNAYDNIKKKIDSIGNSISGVIKKVGKWALAVFGIRSAYMFVRQAMSTLSQYNEQIATDLEYIRYGIATALQPIIEGIIQLAYKLLSIIAYIAKAWFGVNIFANASAKSFEKNKQAVGGVSKAVSKLQKQLAGFDEMNILQDNGSTSGGGGGGGGIKLPSFDLSEIQEPDFSIIYSWTDKLKEIFNNTFDNIKKNVKKVMIDLGFSPEYIKAWSFTVEGIRNIFEGLIDIVGGILKIIVGLFTGDAELVKEGCFDLYTGIIRILVGILKTIVGTIAMVIALVNDSLIKPIKQAIEEFKRTTIGSFFNGIVKDSTTAFAGIKGAFANMPNFFSNMLSTILGGFRNFGTTVGNAIGNAFKSAINGVLSWIETQINKPIDSLNGLLSKLSAVGINMGKISRIRLPRLAKGGIINMPGRGVPIGGAIAGERGAEGVIPLTDSQQMALLGEAIGRYITINANIPVSMNGRVISRELQRVQNDSDFAFNR